MRNSPCTGAYEVQVVASMVFEGVSANLTVYVLNAGLRGSLALAESDLLQVPILDDPEQPGKKDKPDKVVAISGIPASSAPVGAIILVPSVVIPDWPDAETVDRGGDGLPSAETLGLNVSFLAVRNDGTHDAGDVISLTPPAGSTVPVGSLVTVKIWGPSE